MTRAGFAFEGTTPPLIIARLWGALTDDEFRSYLRGYDEIMARGRPVVVIIDARRVEPASASQRKIQADWLIARDADIRKLLLGMAFVLASPIVRAIITAVFWIKPLPCPHTVKASLHDAHEWASSVCARQGIALPPLP
jgi:hypothetical protein